MPNSPLPAWRRRIVLPCLVSSLLAAAACGGGSPPAGGAEPPAADDPATAPPEATALASSRVVWLEVHEMLTRSLEFSLTHQQLDRAKALAVQAVVTAGANTSLGAAAQLACALAEEARRDKKAALRHLRAAAKLLPANATSTDAVVGAVLAAAHAGGETAQSARETLEAWRARLKAASQPEALEAVALATTTLVALPAQAPEHKRQPEIVPPEIVPEVQIDPPSPAPTAATADGLPYPVLTE